MNRAGQLRMAACGFLGLGAALLIAALLLATYTISSITKIPLDIDTKLVSTGTGTALDPSTLLVREAVDATKAKPFVVEKNIPLVLQQQITTESGPQTPSDADLVTLQVGSTLRRTDKQQDAGLLLAIVDTVTLNRQTAMAVSSDTNPAGAVQKPRSIEDTGRGTNMPVRHDGLDYRFPFDVQKKTYQYFDAIAQRTFDANYQGEEDVNGLTTYHFRQNVGVDDNGKLIDPVAYPSLYGMKEDGIVTLWAALWGQPGPPDALITMTRYYAAQRDLWVDPVTGTIVKATERATHYYVRCGEPDCKTRDPLKPAFTLVDYTVTSDDATVEAQVNAARDERDRLAVWGRILPISFAALGIIALVGGVLLGWFSTRAETALIDPGLDGTDRDFFGGQPPPGEPVPGAEATTEKLPTQRRSPPRPPPP